MQTAITRTARLWTLTARAQACDLVITARLHDDGVFSWRTAGVIAGKCVPCAYSGAEQAPRSFDAALAAGIRGACEFYRALDPAP